METRLGLAILTNKKPVRPSQPALTPTLPAAASQNSRLATLFSERQGSDASQGTGEDQHVDNTDETDETAVSGTQRHDGCDGQTDLMVSKNAGELG
jgi:hypothetical protein